MLRTKINLLLFVLIICISISTNAQTTFQKMYGGINNESEGYDFIQTNDNGYLLVGNNYYDSPSGAILQILLIKVFENGDVDWSRNLNGYISDAIYKVRATSDNGFILIGATLSYGAGGWDILLIKCGPNGNVEWTKTYGKLNWEVGVDVQETNDGEYIITGITTPPSLPHQDILLMKVNFQGDLIWDKVFSTPGSDLPRSLEISNDGGYLIGGSTSTMLGGTMDYFLFKTDTGGVTLWSNIYAGLYDERYSSAIHTSNDDIVMCGVGSFDNMFSLIKINSLGDTIFTRHLLSTSGNALYTLHSMFETNDKGIVITGQIFNGSSNQDIFLVKTDSLGTIAWAKAFDSNDMEGIYSVKQTNDGGFALIGVSGIGNVPKMYFIKTDSLGNSGCNEYVSTFVDTNYTLVIVQSQFQEMNFQAITTTPSLYITNGASYYTVCSSVGIPEELSVESRIYPNPASDHLYFDSDKEIELKNLLIYDCRGVLVKEKLSVVGKSSKQTEIDIRTLDNGIYFIVYNDGKESFSHKLVISR